MSLLLVAFGGGVLGLLLVIGAGPAFRYGFPLLVAFGTLALGALLGAIATAAAATGVLLGVKRGQPLSALLVIGLLCGLVAFGVPFQRVWSARRFPATHDVSTDLVNPPAFQAVLPLRAQADNSAEFSEEAAREQRRAYPDLQPILLTADAGQVFDRAIDAARDMGWEIVAADRATGRIEATDTTRWFGFKDDIVVRIAPDGQRTRVDVRSLSRIGRGDLGTNAARVRSFLDRLRDE